jgi:hypothetical protein
MTTPLERHLAKLDAQFNSEAGLLRTIWHGPGYHTKVPNGTPSHVTLENVNYALHLVVEGGAGSLARAEGILGRVLPLQERNPVEPTYGIWSWIVEEPLAEMAPPDWNWADFIGLPLAHLLTKFADRLSPALREETRVSLYHAGYSIFRRNVEAGYTNIAVKGAIVSSLAGYLLGERTLVDYGLARLRRFREYTRHHGGFAEYNSPNYGVLILHIVERGLFLAPDEAGDLRELLEWLRLRLWELFADTLHLGTGQFCGPQSRAYEDILPEGIAVHLESRLGFPLFRRGNPPLPANAPSGDLLVPSLPCPEAVRERILAEAREPESFRRAQYIRGRAPDEDRVASIWKTPRACLGSINHQIFWTQCRSLQGCWREGDEVAVLRMRCKHDGRDFSSGALWTAQNGPEALVLCGLVTDKGDHHPGLDRPADGVFKLGEFEFALELTCPAATARALPEGGFELAGNEHRVRVQPALTLAPGFTVEWRAVEREGFAAVRALVNGGAPLRLAPAELEEFLIGLYLGVDVDDPAPLEQGVVNGRATLRAPGLEVSAPVRPGAQVHFKG